MTTKIRALSAALALVLVAALASCGYPDGTRYVDRVFDETTSALDIVYRNATNHNGTPAALKIDIYQPAGDTATNRPVMLWMFGGGWTFGDRKQMGSYAQDSAKRGFVGVTIDYRIRPGGTGGDIQGAANDAYDDALVAVAWLKARAGQYRLNPNAIVPGGISAGAFNALHLIYKPGTRGPAKPTVAGAVAMSGFSFDTPKPNRPPAIMHHGTADDVVPYAAGKATCDEAKKQGNVCDFYTYQGGGHYITFTHFEEVTRNTAVSVFTRILRPAGYPVEPVG